ncbi:metal-dependent hydrolase [Clostridium niameyense]|uniref:Metal-dependent hydrolase n=1 Tax=Clostridium niameyense TaxID=1622073 RepID=A0A6M0RD86_9CLOT|nr:metal-dependent hydrolase [Clostridium niameyense]NEZ47228.1 metal-dependent hydrolase [Clostridium niameyense]
MTGKTHVAIATASMMPFIPKNKPEMFMLIPFVLLGVLLPDIDADYSLIRSKRYLYTFIILGLVVVFNAESNVPIIGISVMLILIFILKKTEHRTVMHSLLGLMIFTVCMICISKKATIYFVLGYVTHLLADSFTISGIPLFYPRLQSVGRRKIKTGSSQEMIIKYSCLFIVILKTVIIVCY